MGKSGTQTTNAYVTTTACHLASCRIHQPAYVTNKDETHNHNWTIFI